MAQERGGFVNDQYGVYWKILDLFLLITISFEGKQQNKIVLDVLVPGAFWLLLSVVYAE